MKPLLQTLVESVYDIAGAHALRIKPQNIVIIKIKRVFSRA